MTPGPDPRLVMRPSVRSLNTSVRVALFLGLVGTGVLVDVIDPSVVVLVVIGVAWVVLAAAIWWRPKIELTPAGISARSLAKSQYHDWDDITAVWLKWWVLSRHEQGHICIVSRHSARATADVNRGHLLSEKSRLALVDFMRTHVPGVPVNPTPPWQDRFGVWHAGAR